MNADLERLIALQRLDSAAHDAERRLAEEPDREKALDARLDAARERVAAAKERLADNQTARREHEKNVAVHQGRLSKFREQAMAVKTNQEYHAIQNEIEFAQTEIKDARGQDPRADARSRRADGRASRRAEAELAAEQKKVDADRKAMAAEIAELQGVARAPSRRTRRGRRLADPAGAGHRSSAIAQRRNGVAVAEARDGICTICHVRLRPQVFNTVRRNDEIIQCDSCKRILYFVPVPRGAARRSAGSRRREP